MKTDRVSRTSENYRTFLTLEKNTSLKQIIRKILLTSNWLIDNLKLYYGL